MGWVLVYVVVVTGFFVVLDVVTRPSRLFDARLRRRRRILRALQDRRVHEPTTSTVDPFAVLAVQFRLAAMATEIQRIEADRSSMGGAHHLRASQQAYDKLLLEACALAGLSTQAPDPDDDLRLPSGWVLDEDERMRQELELGARGWSW